MIDVFIPKRFSPDCHYQRFQFLLRGVQFDSTVWCTPRSLTPRWDAHRGACLCGGKHIEELDSAVGCTPRSFLRNLDHLTPRCDAHHVAWLRSDAHLRTRLSGEMHTAESDYFENVCFSCFVFIISFNYILSKNFWSKKDFLNNVWLMLVFSCKYR